MNRIKKAIGYFSAAERILWSASVFVILFSFLIFDRENHMTLFASLLGVTSLIFNAKGNPVGQFLMVIFSLLYGLISYSFSYYGEMITYLGMTMPMAVFALIAWLRNPYNENKAEVKVNAIHKAEIIFIWIMTANVTIAFYFLLDYFDTANLLPSTVSVTTSSFRRSPYFALAYAANDVVLILLWIMASVCDAKYISVVVCFSAFLINDIYGFISWRKMKIRQRGYSSSPSILER